MPVTRPRTTAPISNLDFDVTLLSLPVVGGDDLFLKFVTLFESGVLRVSIEVVNNILSLIHTASLKIYAH